MTAETALEIVKKKNDIEFSTKAQPVPFFIVYDVDANTLRVTQELTNRIAIVGDDFSTVEEIKKYHKSFERDFSPFPYLGARL